MANMNTLHELVAAKLERANATERAALLRIPLENIERWLVHGHTAPHRLKQWRQIIERAEVSAGGFQELLGLLRDRDNATEKLREFAPFAGVLTAAERLTVIRLCVYSH